MRSALLAHLRAKQAGLPPRPQQNFAVPRRAVNLMEALRRSISPLEPATPFLHIGETDCVAGHAKGQLKAAEKVGAAAARVLSRNHGHRYYGWSYEHGVFRFFEHPVHFAREQAYEGKYVIQTEEPNLSAIDAVRLYKELSEVERSFANLKDVIDMRPIYHQTDDRVEAHIFVAALAFLIHRALEKKLKAARLDLSATEALTILKSVRVVDIDLGDGTTKRSVTPGPQRAAAVLRATGITDLDPPTPPIAGQTVM
jgi:hypothetical protein